MREHVLRCAVCLVFVSGLLTACTPLEKRIDLNYQRAVSAAGGSGEVFVAKPELGTQPLKMPGGRSIVGTVKDAGTQIVTADDPGEWVMRALIQELYGAGYEIKTVAVMPQDAPKGVAVRILRMSANQTTDGLILTTNTDIELAADLWKNGRLVKTLTVSTGSEDQGLDRSGEFVAEALVRTLQSAMKQLVPGVVKTLEG